MSFPEEGFLSDETPEIGRIIRKAHARVFAKGQEVNSLAQRLWNSRPGGVIICGRMNAARLFSSALGRTNNDAIQALFYQFMQKGA